MKPTNAGVRLPAPSTHCSSKSRTSRQESTKDSSGFFFFFWLSVVDGFAIFSFSFSFLRSKGWLVVCGSMLLAWGRGDIEREFLRGWLANPDRSILEMGRLLLRSGSSVIYIWRLSLLLSLSALPMLPNNYVAAAAYMVVTLDGVSKQSLAGRRFPYQTTIRGVCSLGGLGSYITAPHGYLCQLYM
ncbi:hypothetical protein F5X96DRAFT_101177 [Biscogniauxia mediterranea]|nr:hypothetical protein F5X96DRAFT_101177 [Biscogniauxia mediterranea]